MKDTYTESEKIRYLIGLSGQNIIYGLITSSLAYFLQFTILIPSVWVGIILSFARIFDAVKDPFIGAMIAKGKYTFKDYLTVLPVPTAIVTTLCFANGIYSSNNSTNKNAFIIALAFIFYLLWEIIFSLGDIPITGFPSVLTKNEKEKTKLLSLRPIGSLAAGIIALIFQPIVFSLAQLLGSSAADERNAFLLNAALFSVIGGSMYQFTAFGAKERLQVNADLSENPCKYFKNPLLWKIIISGICGSLKCMPGIILSPLVTYYFASKNPSLSLFYTCLLGFGSFAGMIVSMLTVPKLTEKHSSSKVFASINLLNVLPNLLLFLLYLKYDKNMTDIPQIILMFALTLITGSCTSIAATVQTLIIAETVELQEKISGSRPTALFFSIQTFIVKIGTGISSLTASISYSIINFSSDEAEGLNELVANGSIPRLDDEYSYLFAALFFLYTIPAALSSFLSALPFIKVKNIFNE